MGWAQRYSRQLVDRFRPPELNDNVLALAVAPLSQPFPERFGPRRRQRPRPQEPDAGDPARLLSFGRTRREETTGGAGRQMKRGAAGQYE